MFNINILLAPSPSSYLCLIRLIDFDPRIGEGEFNEGT
jgi:hypothetical protein